jgi:glycosyltransferase involved in cell wall biosynthesis
MVKVNILHLTHTDLRYDNRILKELEALSEIKSYKISALGAKLHESASYADREILANVLNLTLFSYNLKFLPRPILYFFLLLEVSLRFLCYGIKIKPDVVHCHDTMVLPVGLIIKVFYKSKLIYDAHELESDKNGQSKLLSKITLIIEKVCWHRIDHFISVSDSIINWYKKNIGFKQSTLILNSPIINSTNNSYPKRYFHELYNIPNDKLVFVYLGFLGKGRYIESLIKIFSNSNVKSHIVFIGYGELADVILNHQEKCKKIHLHNAITHDHVVNIVKSADMGFCLIENVSLSDYYCLPNKLFEYIFAGVPVVASDFPDLRSMIEKYNLGKCCSLNTDSILKTILEIELNPTGRITTNLEEISWRSQAEKLKSAYISIIKI